MPLYCMCIELVYLIQSLHIIMHALILILYLCIVHVLSDYMHALILPCTFYPCPPHPHGRVRVVFIMPVGVILTIAANAHPNSASLACPTCSDIADMVGVSALAVLPFPLLSWSQEHPLPHKVARREEA